jgi:small nuclear ribonucleoprotein (snRNP)-like protein
MKFDANNASAIFHNFLSRCCIIRIRPVVVKIPEASVVLGWIKPFDNQVFLELNYCKNSKRKREDGGREKRKKGEQDYE